MTVRDWDVEVSANGTSGWTAVSNVVSIEARIGQNYLLEPIQASTATIVARYPNGFATPNTLFLIGNYVRIVDPATSRLVWRGRVSDTQVAWGLPYLSGVGQADEVTVSCEGSLAAAGRTILRLPNGTKSFSNTESELAGEGLTVDFVYTINESLRYPDQDTDGLSFIQNAQQTYQMTVLDGGGDIQIYALDQIRTNTVHFSDVANTSTQQVYDAFGFDSLSENYYTEAVITADVGTATATTGSKPYYSYSTTTFSPSTARAQSLADALIQIYSTRGFDVNNVSAQSEAQASWALDLGRPWWQTPGTISTVTFRGSAYLVFIIGGTFSATPSGSRFTYNLVPTSYRNFLVLDDPTFGKLDENRLGF